MKRQAHALISATMGMMMLVTGASAQDSRARIVGSVTESTGAVVVGATVTAVNTATNVRFPAKTDSSGLYEILYLEPGTYDVTAEAPGFKTFSRVGLELRVADVAKLDMVMEVGQVSQMITVSTLTNLLDTENPSVSTEIDKKSLVDMPISGGDAATMVMMSPGVVNLAIANHPYELTSVGVASRIAVGGMRSQNTAFTVDGVPVMYEDSVNYIPPVDLIQQVETEPSSFSATYGHSVGGYVNSITRSGENVMHGSLYEFHTDASLEGLNIFQRNQLNALTNGGPATKAELDSVKGGAVSNRYGGSIGGPIVIPKLYNGHDKSFWIFGYEGFRNPNTDANSGSYFSVPTAAERGGDFSALLALGSAYQIYDPATTTAVGNGLYQRQPFPGNIIPPGRIDGAAKTYLNYYPAPNNSATVTTTGLNNYFHPVRDTSNYDLESARVDHVFNEKDRIFGRFNFGHFSGLNVEDFGNSPAEGYNGTGYRTGVAISNVYIFSPDFLVNVRYGFTRDTPRDILPSIALTSLGLPSGLVDEIPTAGRYFPQLIIDAGAYTETSPNAPTGGPISNYHTEAIDFTKVFGRQSLQFGQEFRAYAMNNYILSDSSPSMTFASTYTNGPYNTSPAAAVGQGLASFLLGIPTGGSITDNTSYAMSSLYHSGYFQDDFKVAPRFTLNLGLRYEYYTAPTERHNRVVEGFNFTTPSPIAAQVESNYAANPISQIAASQFAVNGGLTFAGVNGNPPQIWQSDRHNFAPRVGADFQINDKTVVRGGYGVFYMSKGVDYGFSSSQYDRWAVIQTGFSQVTTLVPSLNNGVTFVASLENPFPNGFVSPTGAAAGLGTAMGTSVSFYNHEQENPFVQKWSFGFQRQLPDQWMVEVMYEGTYGKQLETTKQLDPVPRQYLSTSATRNQTVINTLSAAASNPFYPMLPGTSLAGTTVATSQLLLPYPQFTGITYDDPVGTSIYHAADLLVERRFRTGFSFEGSYTFSKFIQQDEYLNPSDIVPTHVISDQDIPERMALSGLYDVPIGTGRRFGDDWNPIMKGIAGGWEISAVWFAQSGTPLGFGDAVFNGNVHSITLPNSEKSINEWFNVNAGFDRSAADALADNIQTFPLRLPGVRTAGQSDVNDSAMKYFPLTERTKLEFRCEMMNAFNRSQLAAPNTTPTSSLFGTISSVQSVARQIFFAGKIIF
jgi:Carboxypeptidase regulatory-like domain/TonB-dependent Receptor Plug Domain